MKKIPKSLTWRREYVNISHLPVGSFFRLYAKGRVWRIKEIKPTFGHSKILTESGTLGNVRTQKLHSGTGLVLPYGGAGTSTWVGSGQRRTPLVHVT